MSNIYLVFVINLVSSNLFLGGTFKVFLEGLYKFHVLWFFRIDIWYNYIILVELDLSTFGVQNLVCVPAIIDDAEVYTFKIWSTKEVSDSLLVYPSLDGPKYDLLVRIHDPCITFPIETNVPLSCLFGEFLVVHLIICRSLINIYLGRVEFIALLGFLVQYHVYLVFFLFVVPFLPTGLVVDISNFSSLNVAWSLPLQINVGLCMRNG